MALSTMVVVVAALACKGKADGDTPAASATPVTNDTATAPPATASDTAPASASAPPPPPSAAVKPPAAKCKGLMINKRCARECTTDSDCPDPRERCDRFSGFDDNNQDVQGAVVCQYDKDNEPRAAAPTVGVAAPAGGDCAQGWLPSVTDANKCDKECKADAECGPGNKCKAVGPVGIGKQCQKG